jgi:mRNA-degrading endonuclease toxin of MazEF toxin-antitoxin module
VVLCDQIKSLVWRARRTPRITTVPGDVMHEVIGRVLALVDPEP